MKSIRNLLIAALFLGSLGCAFGAAFESLTATFEDAEYDKITTAEFNDLGVYSIDSVEILTDTPIETDTIATFGYDTGGIAFILSDFDNPDPTLMCDLYKNDHTLPAIVEYRDTLTNWRSHTGVSEINTGKPSNSEFSDPGWQV